MNKSVMFKVLGGVLAVLILAYVGFHGYMAATHSLKTEYALHYTHYDTIQTNGYFVREETLIEQDVAGVVNYQVPNGGRVAQGGTIAQVYPNEEQANTQIRIQEIDQTIADLTELQNGANLSATDSDMLQSQINNNISKLLSLTDQGSLTGLSTLTDETLLLLNKKQIATGTAPNFQGKIDQLKAEKSTLAANANASATTVKAPASGYFVGNVDGHENLISTDQLTTVTAAEIRQAQETEQPASNNPLGKVITSYDWYIACIVTEEQANALAPGDAVTVVMPLSTLSELPVTVYCINKNSTNGECVVVLQCNYMNSELSSLRTSSLGIRTKKYEGLRVSKSAVRIVDGIQGVYILNGIQASFREIDILYADTDYVICALNSEKSNSLKYYDEVLVEGNDLYDGKVVN